MARVNIPDPRVRRVLLTGGAGLLLTLVALATAAWALVRTESERRSAGLSERAREAAALFVETLAERVPDDAWIPLGTDGRALRPPPPRAFRPLPPVSDRAGEFVLLQGAADPSLAAAAHELALQSSDAVVRLAAARAAVASGRDAAEALRVARLPEALRASQEAVALGLLAGADWAREHALSALGSTDDDAAAALLSGALPGGLALVRGRRDALRLATGLADAARTAVRVSPEAAVQAVFVADGSAVLVGPDARGASRATRIAAADVERAARSDASAGVARGVTSADGVRVPLPGAGGWVAWARSGDDATESALVIGGFSLFALAAVVAFSAFANGVARESRQSRLRTEFVATVGHELRTPVAVVRSSAEALALGRANTPEDRERLVGGILRESERLSALLGNVLDFARMESGRRSFSLSASDLGATVQRVVEAHRPALDREEMRLAVELADDLPEVPHDADAVGAAVVNLLDNAAKFAPGDVTLTVRAARGGAEIVVTDHGPGVPLAERARVFERFARGASPEVRDVRGSGIGLALVRHAAEAHDGTVSIVETPGGGATFVVWLPGRSETRG